MIASSRSDTRALTPRSVGRPASVVGHADIGWHLRHELDMPSVALLAHLDRVKTRHSKETALRYVEEGLLSERVAVRLHHQGAEAEQRRDQTAR